MSNNNISGLHPTRTLKRELASRVTRGCIVEIGVAYGDGIKEICGVTKAPVVGIDPFLPYVSFLGGGRYGPETKRRYLENIAGVVNLAGKRPILIEKRAEVAAATWQGPIGLLWVDIGADKDYTWQVIKPYEPFVIQYIAINGLEYSSSETPELVRRLERQGMRDITDQIYVAVLQRVRFRQAGPRWVR